MACATPSRGSKGPVNPELDLTCGKARSSKETMLDATP